MAKISSIELGTEEATTNEFRNLVKPLPATLKPNKAVPSRSSRRKMGTAHLVVWR